jgi:hypothetical protein
MRVNVQAASFQSVRILHFRATRSAVKLTADRDLIFIAIEALSALRKCITTL